ncbi:MAG: hypothetical protein IKR11_11835 [Solobacterium sp.]|nr:hypothetical protein [Solobacterium sp.]
MFDEKSIEEVKEIVYKRINELEGMVANQSETIKEQEKNLSDAIAYIAKISGISEKEALELIHSQKNKVND